MWLALQMLSVRVSEHLHMRMDCIRCECKRVKRVCNESLIGFVSQHALISTPAVPPAALMLKILHAYGNGRATDQQHFVLKGEREGCTGSCFELPKGRTGLYLQETRHFSRSITLT